MTSRSRICINAPRGLGLVFLGWLSLKTLVAAAPDGAADDWLAEPGTFPAWIDAGRVVPGLFEEMQAEVLAGRLKIRWKASSSEKGGVVLLHASVDKPGHWPARDWRHYPMIQRDQTWEATVPVDHVDVPILYFVSVRPPDAEAVAVGGWDSGSAFQVSPWRLCWPSRLGMEEPTRVFWPFLDGFEEGMDGWRLLSDVPGQSLEETFALPKNGKVALQATVPAGKRSVAVATTRVRGWQVLQQQATGVSLWMRVREGTGLARFTLFSQALTTNQVIAPCRWEAPLEAVWKRINLPFEDFRGVVLPELDLLAMEFIGEGPQEFWVDDLQLMGSWPLD